MPAAPLAHGSVRNDCDRNNRNHDNDDQELTGIHEASSPQNVLLWDSQDMEAVVRGGYRHTQPLRPISPHLRRSPARHAGPSVHLLAGDHGICVAAALEHGCCPATSAAAWTRDSWSC